MCSDVVRRVEPVAVVRGTAKHRHTIIVFEPSELEVVWYVAPDQVPALRAPRWTLRPQRARPDPFDRRVALNVRVEGRIDSDDVRVWIYRRWRVGSEVAGRIRDGAWRLARRAL